MIYLVKTPDWLKRIYLKCVWHIATTEKILYLTFDDGPHPEATNFVLDTLDAYNARASFFCIGKNVDEHPDLYNRVLEKGHAVGNHTYDHLNGWTTNNETYFNNIEQAQKLMNTTLFRPPYGKISFKQVKYLRAKMPAFKIIMWSVISADFDTGISKEKCLQNVLKNCEKGSIIVFHDSEKAFENLKYTLPRVMAHFTNLGYSFKKIEG